MRDNNIIKKSLIVCFLCFSNILFCQEVFSEKEMIDEYRKKDQFVSKQIMRMETKDTISITVKRYYNLNNDLVKEVKFQPHSSLGLSGLRTNIYRNKKISIAVNEDVHGVIWSLSLFEYSINGKLVEVKEFDISTIYKRVSTGVPASEILYDSKGKKISNFTDAKRRIPYQSN